MGVQNTDYFAEYGTNVIKHEAQGVESGFFFLIIYYDIA